MSEETKDETKPEPKVETKPEPKVEAGALDALQALILKLEARLEKAEKRGERLDGFAADLEAFKKIFQDQGTKKAVPSRAFLLSYLYGIDQH